MLFGLAEVEIALIVGIDAATKKSPCILIEIDFLKLDNHDITKYIHLL